MTEVARTEIKKLVLPYDSLRTIYEGASDVRLYRNNISGALQVGKRIDVLGLEETVAFREATLLQQIDHPNIVKVQDVARVEGYDKPLDVIEIVMPYFERGSVCDALARGHRFSVGGAARHMQKGLAGLGELHECHRLLHRDVKSPNVFLADDGSLLKVGDLGISIEMEDDGSAEAYNSPQLYMAPEAFTTHRCDRRSDLYSAGLLFFEMLNGPLPYNSYTIDAIVQRLEKGRAAPRSTDLALGPYVPRRLRMVVRKAMKTKPEERFTAAWEMSQAIAGADFVDWTCVHDDLDLRIWEGVSTAYRDRFFRVEAKRHRRGGWTLSGLQVKNRPQRVVQDVRVNEVAGTGATEFFDHVVEIATAR